jgi:hypothetical protein
VEVTVRKISGLTLQMLNKEADATLAALLGSVRPRRWRSHEGRSRRQGVDADFFVKWKHGMPLKGQRWSSPSGRPPPASCALYV